MDPTEVMSKYERIATIISIVAIIFSVLIPLCQWIWKRWIETAKVTFHQSGQATLFFNQSGSYIRFNGVIESKNKAATIRKMSLTVQRNRDERKLNLEWSYLISPIHQSMLGNIVQTMEVAHPFRVEADSVACAFIEYSDPSDSSGIKIRKICSDLAPTINTIVSECTCYDDAWGRLSKELAYSESKKDLLNDFFWDTGKYSVDVIVEYDKGKTKRFSYMFSVSEQNYTDLRSNIDESLVCALKGFYRQAAAFKTPMVEIIEKTK